MVHWELFDASQIVLGEPRIVAIVSSEGHVYKWPPQDHLLAPNENKAGFTIHVTSHSVEGCCV